MTRFFDRDPSASRRPVSESDHGPRVVVVPPAELDMLTAPQVLSDGRRSLAAHPQMLVIDMAGVRFLAAKGVHALLQVREEAGRAGVGFELGGVQGNAVVCRVLAITKLTEIFDIGRVDRAGGS